MRVLKRLTLLLLAVATLLIAAFFWLANELDREQRGIFR